MAALVFAPCAATVLLTAQPASAQVVGGSFRRDRNVAVRNRPRPAYDALGIRSGAFLLYPKVTVDGTYDDNIYGQKTNTTQDFITTATGQISANSNWNRHRLNAYVRGARAEYSDRNFESNTTYGTGASGQLDFRRDLALNGALSYDRLVEARTASGTPLSAKSPIRFDQYAADLGLGKAFNRLRVRGAFGYRYYNYHDYETVSGQQISQAYRDEKTYTTSLQLDYAVSPDTALFVRGQRDWRTFSSLQGGTVTRDSQGYDLTTGVDFELSALMRGQIGVGYLSHSFDDPRVSNVSSFSANAQVEYFPTQLLTVTLRGSRSVADTGLINTAGFLTTNVSAQGDYELLRNLIITGRLGYGKDSYRGLDRSDKRFTGSIAATYLLNRSLGINAQYSRSEQSSSGTARGPEFDVNRISLSLTLQR